MVAVQGLDYSIQHTVLFTVFRFAKNICHQKYRHRFSPVIIPNTMLFGVRAITRKAVRKALLISYNLTFQADISKGICNPTTPISASSFGYHSLPPLPSPTLPVHPDNPTQHHTNDARRQTGKDISTSRQQYHPKDVPTTPWSRGP